MIAPRVVLVDDSLEILSVLTEILRLGGPYQVQQLSGGETTFDDIERARPDLIVLDLAFGDDRGAGWDLLGQIRASGTATSQAAVIVCTGAVDEVRKHIDDLATLGGVRRLQKPFSIEEFESAVRACLPVSRA